jgi:hydrogenase/urease accessory protein HupE
VKRRPAIVRAALRLILLGVVTGVLLWCSLALGHPFAISQVSIRSQEQGLAVGFQFNATSVVDLVQRVRPQLKDVDKTSLAAHGGLLLAYVDSRFRVSNEGRACRRDRGGPAPKLWLEPRGGKVPLSLAYRCDRPVGRLRIESELWRDENTPHTVIATVRHGRGAERFFFNKKNSRLEIDLAQLDQPRATSSSSSVVPSVVSSRPPSGAWKPSPPAPGAIAPKASFFEFVNQGVVHIFGGLDHVLFVIVLLLAAHSWRQLAWIVTSFTVAHSITIALTALELVRVAPIVVEPIIAASIVYVAIENVVREEPRHRLGVTFGFGLVHGLGFGSVLLDLGIVGGELVPMLFGFNVGVEIGQLAIVLPLFAGVRFARKREWRVFPAVRVVTCLIVALAGCVWVVQRLTGMAT